MQMCCIVCVFFFRKCLINRIVVFQFLTLITESITIFSDDVWYFTWLTRQEKILIHGILLSIATLFAVLATALEYYRKRKLQFHYDTVHGVTGNISRSFKVMFINFMFFRFSRDDTSYNHDDRWIPRGESRTVMSPTEVDQTHP